MRTIKPVVDPLCGDCGAERRAGQPRRLRCSLCDPVCAWMICADCAVAHAALHGPRPDAPLPAGAGWHFMPAGLAAALEGLR